MSGRRIAIGWLALSILAGCTFEDGAGWATVQLSASGHLLVDDEHVSPDGATLRTDQDVDVWIDLLDIDIAGVALLESAVATDGDGAAFDPAHPPLGYTLCHGGHCHATDGSLRSYEAIAAELAGSGTEGSLEEVAAFAVSATLDALASVPTPLGEHEIGDVSLAGVRLDVARVRVEGRVQVGGGTTPLRISLAPAEPVSLTSGASAPIGRDGWREALVDLLVELPSTWLDGIRFPNLEQAEGTVVVDATTNAAVAELLWARIAELEAGVGVTGEYSIVPTAGGHHEEE